MESIKQETLKLYDKLPQDEESRIARLDIRDAIIEKNMRFFNYIATHTFLNNTYITLEDKIQAVVMHFCECWYWYKWEGHYRTDLSFAVFYFPRISEMLRRDFNEVKYSTRRRLCMEVGDQVGKHWGQVKLEDVEKANLPEHKLESLRAIFGTLNPVDIEDVQPYLREQSHIDLTLETTEYDDIKEMVVQEIIYLGRPLKIKDFKRMSEMYYVDENCIIEIYPSALEELYCRLQDLQEIRKVFE